MTVYLRDTKKLKNLICFKSFRDFNNFNFCCLKVGEEYNFTIKFKELNFDFKLIVGEIDSLIAFFNSAIPESKSKNITFPFFTGLGISKSLKSTKIFFCDPLLQLSKNNKAFWYIGSKKLPTQQILIDILSIINNQLSIKKMVFWGSSGGGYPALFLSNFFKNSIALVNAPTTTLKDHHNIGTVSNIEATLLDSLNDQISSHLDLSNFTQNKNKAIFLQNQRDRVFINFHLTPYLKQKKIKFENVSILEGDLKVIYQDWGRGHLVAPSHILRNLFRFLERKETDYSASLTVTKINSIVNYDICISDMNKYFEVKILNVEEESTYAVYLCKGARVIDKVMYQSSNTFRLEKKYGTGNYYIKAFSKFNSDGFSIINDSITFVL